MMDGWCTRYKFFRIIVIYTLTLNLSTSLLKLLFGFLGFENGLLLAFVMAQTIAGIIYFISVKRKRALPKFRLFSKSDFQVGRNYLNFPRYNMPHALINTLSSNLPVLILTFYFSEYYTGQFAVAFALLFKPVQVYAGSVSQALSQKVVELKNNNQHIWPLIKKYLVRTFLMAILPAILLFIIAPELFRIVLGDNWVDAGKMCRLLIPWPLAVLHGGSLAFIPNVFSRQLKALVIDIIYILLRLAALAVGVITGNVFLGIGLFSLTGFFVIGYAVFWYISIIRKSDANFPAKQ
jgi:O-antigen/teichoic acid export membrane protein